MSLKSNGVSERALITDLKSKEKDKERNFKYIINNYYYYFQ